MEEEGVGWRQGAIQGWDGVRSDPEKGEPGPQGFHSDQIGHLVP